MDKSLLRGTKWKNWEVTPIAGDASSRQYARLSMNEETVIWMSDPPKSGNGTVEFEAIAQLLRANQLRAPEVFFHDPKSGQMINEDLGGMTVSHWIKINPDSEAMLYDAIFDQIFALEQMVVPLDLPKLDRKSAIAAIEPALIYYAKGKPCGAALMACLNSAYEDLVDPTMSFALRDYHSENLIWRDGAHGLDRLGILDFQDACFAPAGYDLMSLLRDARRDVSPPIVNSMISRFCAKTGVTKAHLAVVSAQRNLRILGIFSRLAVQNGKQAYLRLIPRVWKNLMLDLSEPELTNLKKAVLQELPKPKGEV